MTDEINRDGYMNVLTGVGTGRDPTTQTFYAPDPLLQQQQLEAIFEGDGIGRRVVEMPAEEMCRGWFDVVADKGEGVLDYLETLRAQQAFTDAVVWARLYGGSLVYLILEDGKDDAQPVDFTKIRKLVGVQVFDRFSVGFETDKPSKDPVLRLMGRPEIYNLSPMGGGLPLRVHESRVVYIPGRRLDPRRRMVNAGWDASMLQGAFTALQRYGSGMGYAANILRDFVQATLSVKDLTTMLAAGRDDVVQRRIRLLDMSRSILNMIVLDADGEEYNKSSSSVAGLADILDRFAETLSASVGIPVAKLFGRSTGGLNATGEHDLRNYYDMLAAEQNRVLDPLAEAVVKVIFNAQDGPTSGAEPEDWSVRWRPLWSPTDTEVATLRKSVADADKIYLDTGVLSPDEVADSRFGSGEWSMETTLDAGTDRKAEAAGSDTDAEKGIERQQALQPTTPGPSEQRGDEEGDAPEPLYIRRDVVNRSDFVRWAKAQGAVLDASELHCTILYSETPVDWFKMGFDWAGNDNGQLHILEGGPRKIVTFGEAVVLRFASSQLEWRHESLIERGASHGFPEYKPHITLPGVPGDVAVAYTGPIILGPEIFEQLDLSRGDMAMNQPRAPKGSSNGGQWIKGAGGSKVKPPKATTGPVAFVWQVAKQNPNMTAAQIAKEAEQFGGVSAATAKKQAYLAKLNGQIEQADLASVEAYVAKQKAAAEAPKAPAVEAGYTHKPGLSDEAMTAMNKAALSVATGQYPTEKILALKDKDPKTLSQYEKKKLLAYKKALQAQKVEMAKPGPETKEKKFSAFEKEAFAVIGKKHGGPVMQAETVEKLVSGEWKPDPHKPWQAKVKAMGEEFVSTGNLNLPEAPKPTAPPWSAPANTGPKLTTNSFTKDPPPVSSTSVPQTALVAPPQNLPANAHTAIASYTGSGYQEINGALRHDADMSEHLTRRVKAIDKAIAASKAKTDLVLVRGISPSAFEKMTAHTNGQIPGAVLQDKGFVSTTRQPGTAHSFAGGNGYGLKIRVPAGWNILPAKQYSNHASEDEFILPRGSKFKVASFDAASRVLLVDLHKD